MDGFDGMPPSSVALQHLHSALFPMSLLEHLDLHEPGGNLLFPLCRLEGDFITSKMSQWGYFW